MKNFLLGLAVLASLLPTIASADSYNGPYCFERPDAYSGTPYQADPQHIRGTCKSVTATTVVLLDPTLAKDYFLGWHEPACMAPRADVDGCSSDSKYSEDLHITASSTAITAIDDQAMSYWYGEDFLVEGPLSYATFDKQFFTPLLLNKFASIGETFSEDNFPQVGIHVLNKSELDAIGGSNDSGIVRELENPDTFQKWTGYGGDRYSMTTLDSAKYGKYIHAPKWKLIESQYVSVETSSNLLTSADLQVTREGCGHWDLATCLVVPVASPLKEVRNYWLYTKKNGKLTLSWQKSEYTLDNGTTKTITPSDTKVSAALLFGGTSTTTTSAAPENKKGFFARILDFILSWFR